MNIEFARCPINLLLVPICEGHGSFCIGNCWKGGGTFSPANSTKFGAASEVLSGRDTVRSWSKRGDNLVLGGLMQNISLEPLFPLWKSIGGNVPLWKLVSDNKIISLILLIHKKGVISGFRGQTQHIFNLLSPS